MKEEQEERKRRKRHRGSGSHRSSGSHHSSDGHHRRRHRRHKRREKELEDDSRSNSSGSEEEGREAVVREHLKGKVGDILTSHPEMEDFLVKIVEHLDKGNKVDVRSVPDLSLKSKLVDLFLLLRNRGIRSSKENQVFQVSSKSGASVQVREWILDSIQAHQNKGSGKQVKEKRSIGPEMPIGPALPPKAIGPQMPPSGLGAELPEHVPASFFQDLEEEDFVGPVPVVAGGPSLKSAEEEIERILNSARSNGNSYHILGVEPISGTKDIVKRYLKLSLLIHPDKCKAPKAQEAFTVLNKAKEELRDESRRSKLDDKLDDERLWDMAMAEAKRRQQASDWESIRTTGHVCKQPKGPPQRESWMTDVPESGPSHGIPQQINVTRFRS